MGDPHITTLDVLTYTLNVVGVYTLLGTEDNTLTIHAYVEQSKDTFGNTISASEFKGFAFKTSNSPVVQINMNRASTGKSRQ